MTAAHRPTADQTVGPFFRDGLDYTGDRDLVPRGSLASIVLDGRVLDGAGTPVPDALVEVWQPDADGTIIAQTGSRSRPAGTFTGFGRCETDADGWYAFTTLAPAPLRPGAAAFFAIQVFARGLLANLSTRIYLPDDAAALASDPLLARLPVDRQTTLIAEWTGPSRLTHHIHLQGNDETVFLAFR